MDTKQRTDMVRRLREEKGLRKPADMSPADWADGVHTTEDYQTVIDAMGPVVKPSRQRSRNPQREARKRSLRRLADAGIVNRYEPGQPRSRRLRRFPMAQGRGINRPRRNIFGGRHNPNDDGNPW